MSFVSDIKNKGIERAKEKVAEINSGLPVQQSKLATTTNQTQSITISEQQTTKKNKWIVPVVIGAGAIVLGVVMYFVVKKKK